MNGAWMALGSVGLLAAAGLAGRQGSRKVEGMPSSRERRRRLREAALAGQRGRKWYHKAEQQIRTVAKAWAVDPIYVAVAVAATSPATPVISSPRMARGGGMASNIGKARRVVKRHALRSPGSEVLHPKSPGLTRLVDFERCLQRGEDPPECLAVAFPKPDRVKTHSFVRNLIGYADPVTVDSLIARGVGVPVSSAGIVRVTEARHAAVAEDIKAVAKQLGWEPREVMAAAWTAWGGSGDLGLATSRERSRADGGGR